MKKTTAYLALLITVLGFIPLKAKADHAAGAELLYEWVSDSTYRIYWKFYRDCAGRNIDSSQDLCVKNRCDSFAATYLMFPVAGILPNGSPNGSEVQRMCPGVNTNCTDPNSILPGFQEWWYTTVITLPSRCNYWEFSATVNSRNHATNLVNPGNLWVDATLDNLHFQGDSSPYFTVKPVYYVCDNAEYHYYNGSVDINGDSLYFQLEYPSTSALCADTLGANLDTFDQSNIPGPGGFSIYNLFNNPLRCTNTFSLNHRNGEMYFTPQGQQWAALNLLVTSYRSGVLIGHVMRDLQVIVRECPVQQPYLDVKLTTITGGAIDYNGVITTCSGNTLNFGIKAISVDTSALLAISDNHLSATPGAAVTYTNFGTDSVNSLFSWTPGRGNTGTKALIFIANDTSCRPPGIMLQQNLLLLIHVMPGTIANHPDTIELGDTAHLSAAGGSNFVWSALPPDSSLSCTVCATPVARPLVTTRYVVTSDLVSACRNTDTFTITVIPVINKIGGTITISADSVNPANPVCKVWLIMHDTVANTLTAVDSTIDTGAYYSVNYQFMNEPGANYIIKAALLNGPVSGTGPAPTYDSASLYWDSAQTIIYTGHGQSLGNNIVMQQGIITTGPGFIGGNITSGANKGSHATGSPVPGMLVLLKKAANHLVAFTYTDMVGNYGFGNLPAGYYEVYPEAENYKTTEAVHVSSTSMQSADFKQHTLSKTITPASLSATAVLPQSSVRIYPNPTRGLINIALGQLSSQAADITITDVVGRKIATTHLDISNNGLTQLDLSPCQSGLYFINLRAGGINYTDKVLLQR